jgi:DNA-binding transcriptional regulator YiaG
MRKELGLTQKALAQILGVNRVTVARWEAGTRKPPRMAQNFMEFLLKTGKGRKSHGKKEK